MISLIWDQLSLDTEINTRIGPAVTTFASLTKRVWENGKLTALTKVAVCWACVLNALLYGSESWTLYSRQELKGSTRAICAT